MLLSVVILLLLRMTVTITVTDEWHEIMDPADASAHVMRQGTDGVSTNGVAVNFMCFFDRGTFGVPPLTYFYLPNSARACLFPQSDRRPAPLVLTAFVRSQSMFLWGDWGE